MPRVVKPQDVGSVRGALAEVFQHSRRNGDVVFVQAPGVGGSRMHLMGHVQRSMT
jgi:hypothetical protein